MYALMEKPYTLLDHTADLRLRIIGCDKSDLFNNAGRALSELICDPDTLTSAETAHIDVTGDDPADLMVNYLRELLYLWTGNEKLIKSVQMVSISDTALSARITTDDFVPGRHAILNEIKAVTYHQIDVGPTTDGWQATVVLDI